MKLANLVARLGGRDELARVLKVGRTAIYNWERQGYFPLKHHLALSRIAEARGVRLPASRFAECGAAYRATLASHSEGAAA